MACLHLFMKRCFEEVTHSCNPARNPSAQIWQCGALLNPSVLPNTNGYMVIKRHCPHGLQGRVVPMATVNTSGVLGIMPVLPSANWQRGIDTECRCTNIPWNVHYVPTVQRVLLRQTRATQQLLRCQESRLDNG